MDQKRSLPCRDLPLRRSEDQTTLNIRERAGGRKRSPRQRIRDPLARVEDQRTVLPGHGDQAEGGERLLYVAIMAFDSHDFTSLRGIT